MVTPQITQEIIADIPLLLHILRDQLEYDKLLDQIDLPYGNWQGLSSGKTMVTWLTRILSEDNHYVSRVQDWVAHAPHLWTGLWGQAVRSLDVSDDRLAEVTRPTIILLVSRACLPWQRACRLWRNRKCAALWRTMTAPWLLVKRLTKQ